MEEIKEVFKSKNQEDSEWKYCPTNFHQISSKESQFDEIENIDLKASHLFFIKNRILGIFAKINFPNTANLFDNDSLFIPLFFSKEYYPIAKEETNEKKKDALREDIYFLKFINLDSSEIEFDGNPVIVLKTESKDVKLETRKSLS